MDIQRLFKSLKDKGISVIAKSNSVVAGLIWGVEGVEKVPKLGEVLFYVVNGTRYGVKPKRGNKHDIDWYYKQLKMGMQGAKAYHAGLTQFLNTWIKKGELEVVFKGKATACAFTEEGVIDKVNLTAIRNYLEQNNIEFDINQSGRIYTFTFDCGKIVLDDNNQKAKLFFEGKVKEVETMRELNNFFSNCKVLSSAKKLSIENKCDSLINGLRNGSINKDVFFKTITKEYNLTPDCVAATRWLIKEWGIKDIKNNNEWPIHFKKLYNLHGVKFLNNYLNDLLFDSRSELSGGSSEFILDGLYKKFIGNKVTATTDYDKVHEYIKKINELKIDGKRAFNAILTSEGVRIDLLLHKWTAENDYDITVASEDTLKIIFPIVKKWMDYDKDKTFHGTKKIGDLVLYTDEYCSYEFNDTLYLERNSSKIDFENLDRYVEEVYESLKEDCDILNGLNGVKITADTVTVEVKETAEVNEENFKGLNEEHDRLMYVKVSPEKFLNLWKTSPEFNGNQIQKIIYGFKLASRTLGSKFENKGILIEYFYSKKYGKGYIRVEYEKELFIIYVARSEDNGDVKVITRKMRKMIPTKNFNLLSTSVSSLAFERANLPPGFKPVWEEVTKSN